jgi:Peptidase family M23
MNYFVGIPVGDDRVAAGIAGLASTDRAENATRIGWQRIRTLPALVRDLTVQSLASLNSPGSRSERPDRTVKRTCTGGRDVRSNMLSSQMMYCPVMRCASTRLVVSLLLLLSVLVGSSPHAAASLPSSAVYPVTGTSKSCANGFGDPRVGHTHQGNDCFRPLGTPLLAVEAGTIVSSVSGWTGSCTNGKLVGGTAGNNVGLLGVSGTYYWYGHLSVVRKSQGASVAAGDQIGDLGDTGNAKCSVPHLHFEIHPGGRGSAAVDPYPIMQATNWVVRQAPGTPPAPPIGLPSGAVPIGNFESAEPIVAGVRLAGWAFDKDTLLSGVQVQVFVDGLLNTTALTSLSRNDVAYAYSLGGNPSGSNIGFALDVSLSGLLAHEVCLKAINTGPSGVDLTLGCRNVAALSGAPVGAIESVGDTSDGASISGWGFDLDSPSSGVMLETIVDGFVAPQVLVSNSARSDIASAYRVQANPSGNNIGFSFSITLPTGEHSVCFNLLNSGANGSNTALGCWQARGPEDVLGSRLGAAWVSTGSTVNYCRRVGAGPNNVNSYLSCTPFNGTSFGATVSSGLTDWGYEDGRAWVSTGSTVNYCRRVGASPNNVNSYLACTPFNGTSFGATVSSGLVDWGYATGAAWVSTGSTVNYCRRVGAGPNNVNSYLSCTPFNGTSFGATVNSGLTDWGYV